MEAPICLISNDAEGHLCVLKEAKEILDGISQPVVVVSVVGLYRTGKSYLMNRLAGKQKGFALGSTIESKTKGIWMWCVPHPIKEGHTLVLLDTEGLGDVHKGDEKHDTWIFCLALLLSSTLIYNSIGVIDNNALEKLHYVTKLTEHIQVKTQASGDPKDSEEFMRVFPSFIWSVRDLSLKLEMRGKAITADEYLESALKLEPSNLNTKKYNLSKYFLKQLFAERRCFVFPRPADDADMLRMEELSETDLHPQFLERAEEFCKHVFSSARTKTLRGGRTLIGSALASLAEVYVGAIRKGAVPCLENAVVTLTQKQNERAVEQALQVYQSQCSKIVCFPLDPSELSDIHRKAETAAIDVFINTSFNDSKQKAQQRLLEKIQTLYQDLCVQNQEENLNICKRELAQIFSPLDKDLSDGSFMCPGGYKKYRDTLQSFINEYTARTHNLMMSKKVLSEYLNEKAQIGENILSADQCLTEAEQKQEVERLKVEALEQKNKFLEEMNNFHQKMLQDQYAAHERYMNKILERMEQERKREREENERLRVAREQMPSTCVCL